MRSYFPNPRTVFVDSGAWLGLADTHDQHHQEALAIQSNIAVFRPRLVITNFIIDETYTLIRYRAFHQKAVQFLDDIRASTVTSIRVTPEDEARAEEILRQYTDKRFSYTDATSFIIMERLGIEAAFTFDRNFTEYGRFQVLAP